MPKNFISFDLELWYDSEFIKDKKNAAKKGDFVLIGLERVEKILDKYNVKATFFVTGKILEKYPKQIKKLHEKGHEISSHNYEHKMLGKMDRREFEEALKKSKKLIKKITKQDPKGFRAPCWSISKKEFWAYDILGKLGFAYSSSIFPVSMGLYGDSSFPMSQFSPIKKSEFIEIPVHPFEMGKIRLPFSGGFYFRILPKKLIEFFIKKLNKKKRDVVLYLHPWEFCPEIPKVKTNLMGRIITYYGLKYNLKKLDYILSRFEFCPLRNNLSNQ